MTEQRRLPGKLVLGLLIGGAAGALAGVLFAPKAGKQLRSEIKEKGSAAFSDVSEIYTDARTKAGKIFEEAMHQATGLKKDADRHITETVLKSKEILAQHENKQPRAGTVEH
ncbi:MAG: YtxH domain-containing protein [Smithellaceae bacterium]